MTFEFPIVLQSKDGRSFRRINADGSFEQKTIGLPWESHDPATIETHHIAPYVETMMTRIGWRICENESQRRPHEHSHC